MVADGFLLAGTLFVLILSVGQLLVKRRQTANRLLFFLFVCTFLWVGHATGYRLGMLDSLPHLNKIYLPVFCLTGSLWFGYVHALHKPDGTFHYRRDHLLAPATCMLLSVPFYLQSAAYKQAYVEIVVSDIPALTMYAASRFSELVLIYYFLRSVIFLGGVLKSKRGEQHLNTSRVLWWLSAFALIASMVRLAGSIVGSDLVSVVLPSSMALLVLIFMHFTSYRSPVVLALDRAPAYIRTVSEQEELFESIKAKIREHQWYLDPNLKLQSLARKLGIPPKELSVLINGGTGGNFNEFINQFRVRHAATLIEENLDRNLTDIYLDSGFNAGSVFYKHFPKVYDLSPGKYRDELVDAKNETSTSS